MEKYLKQSDVLDLISAEVESLKHDIQSLPLDDGQRLLYNSLINRLRHLKFKVLFL